MTLLLFVEAIILITNSSTVASLVLVAGLHGSCKFLVKLLVMLLTSSVAAHKHVGSTFAEEGGDAS